MAHSKTPRYDLGLVSSAYRAIILGIVPIVVLVAFFELLTPESLIADGITIPAGATFFDLSRLVLFSSIGVIHILLCAVTVLLSVSTILSRVPKVDTGKILFSAIVVPIAFIALAFILVCLSDPKIYRISYGRVAHLLSQTTDFSYQFEMCNRHEWLQLLCPSGNFHVGFFGFILIFSGIAASVAVCADIGVSNFHHAKKLTSKRLQFAGQEMHDDINRYAVSLLLVLTSSSVATAVFQPIGISLLKADTMNSMLYEKAALSAALFWPFAFTSIFLGIFVIPALAILRKRTEALRLLDANEISTADYESFFAVREALPQSLRWMILSGLPLAMSLAPRLIEFAN